MAGAPSWITDPSQMDPQTSLGLALLANSNTPGNFGSIFGRSALQAQQDYQNAMMGQLQRQQMQQQLQTGSLGLQQRQMMLNAAQEALGGQGAPPANTPASPGAAPADAGQPAPFYSGISPMPAGGAPASAAPSAPQGLPSGLVPPSMSQIYGTTYPGSASPNYMRAMAMFSQDPAAALLKVREDQLKGAQQQYAPTIARLDQLIKSDSPSKYMQGTGYEDVKAAWPQMAATMGFDPQKDMNDQNVRLALSSVRNQLASSLQEPTTEPPMPLRTIKLPDGRTAQVEPGTGKITPVASEELQQVVGPNGQPTLVPRSQAAGMTPFNSSIFGAANMSDQALQFAADTYRTTGKLPASMGRNPAMQARVLEKVASDASAAGDTAGAIAARSASLKANGQALDQNTKLETATTSYYNTLDKNLTKLQELQGKVDSSGVPLVNKVYRAYQQNVSGSPDVAAYVTYLNSAAAEFAKIQSGSLGNAPVSDSARKHADEIINKYMSAGQINAVVDAMRGEGNNRLSSIRQEGQSIRQSLSAVAPGANKPQIGVGGAAPLDVGQSQSTGGFTITRVK